MGKTYVGPENMVSGRGSIPATTVMCQNPGEARNPYRPYPSSSNGYQVELKLVMREWLQEQKIRASILPRDETVKCVLTLGVHRCKVR